MERIGIELERLFLPTCVTASMKQCTLHTNKSGAARGTSKVTCLAQVSYCCVVFLLFWEMGQKEKAPGYPEVTLCVLWVCLSKCEREGESPGKCWIVSLCFSSGTMAGHVLSWIYPYFIAGICTYKLCFRKWGFVHMCFQAEDLFFILENSQLC